MSKDTVAEETETRTYQVQTMWTVDMYADTEIEIEVPTDAPDDYDPFASMTKDEFVALMVENVDLEGATWESSHSPSLLPYFSFGGETSSAERDLTYDNPYGWSLETKKNTVLEVV